MAQRLGGASMRQASLYHQALPACVVIRSASGCWPSSHACYQHLPDASSCRCVPAGDVGFCDDLQMCTCTVVGCTALPPMLRWPLTPVPESLLCLCQVTQWESIGLPPVAQEPMLCIYFLTAD